MIEEFYKNKNNCVLTPYVNELVGVFGSENCFYPCDEVTKKVVDMQARTTVRIERKVIPATHKAF